VGRFRRRAKPRRPIRHPGNALAEAAEGKQQRCGDADSVICGQRANGEGRQPHGRKRKNQRLLATDAVAEVSEKCGADGTCEEGNAEGSERRQRGGSWVRSREEQAGEHEHCSGGIDVEVEKLDRGPDQAGE